MYSHGWFQVGFERDVTQDLTASLIGTQRLVLVRTAKGIRAFDADCPHRGAHLAYGGKLDDHVIICPFHGYRVGLATESQHGFRIREYPVFTIGGLIFVRLSDSHENGFMDYMEGLATNHCFVPGFEMPVKATASLVIENGFDNRHFSAVHGVRNDPKFAIRSGEHGELLIDSVFDIPATLWRPTRPAGELVPVPYAASTFSPGIITLARWLQHATLLFSLTDPCLWAGAAPRAMPTALAICSTGLGARSNHLGAHVNYFCPKIDWCR